MRGRGLCEYQEAVNTLVKCEIVNTRRLETPPIDLDTFPFELGFPLLWLRFPLQTVLSRLSCVVHEFRMRIVTARVLRSLIKRRRRHGTSHLSVNHSRQTQQTQHHVVVFSGPVWCHAMAGYETDVLVKQVRDRSVSNLEKNKFEMFWVWKHLWVQVSYLYYKQQFIYSEQNTLRCRRKNARPQCCKQQISLSYESGNPVPKIDPSTVHVDHPAVTAGLVT